MSLKIYNAQKYLITTSNCLLLYLLFPDLSLIKQKKRFNSGYETDIRPNNQNIVSNYVKNKKGEYLWKEITEIFVRIN